MSSEKNITMRQFNGTDYDYLYPRTAVGQISGLSDNYYNKNESNGLYLRTDGSNAMSGNINANNHYITNVVTGSSSGDAANKSYVDNQISNTLYSVNIGYNGNVNGTYSASSLIMGSNQFNYQNAVGVLFTGNLICSTISTEVGFIGLTVGNAVCYVNSGERNEPLGEPVLDIKMFIPFQGLEFYTSVSRPTTYSFRYISNYSAGTSYTNSYAWETLSSTDRSTVSTLNFIVPANTFGLYVYGISKTLKISSGWARTDVIYYR